MSTLAKVTPLDTKRALCEKLGIAVAHGQIGEIVVAHQHIIGEYYSDVQKFAVKSFNWALTAAIAGFSVLTITLLYLFYHLSNDPDFRLGIVATLGGVGTIFTQFIAAIIFWLYSKSARQFGAFHICLERTQRYLLSYKMAEAMKDKDATLHELICIMANAVMITQANINSDSKPVRAKDLSRIRPADKPAHTQ
jgi:hypothetical protein